MITDAIVRDADAESACLSELNLQISFPIFTITTEQSGRPVLKRFDTSALVIPLYASETHATRNLKTEAPDCRLFAFDRPQELCRFLRACARFEDNKVSRVAYCTRMGDSNRVVTRTIEEFVRLIERPLDDDT